MSLWQLLRVRKWQSLDSEGDSEQQAQTKHLCLGNKSVTSLISNESEVLAIIRTKTSYTEPGTDLNS